MSPKSAGFAHIILLIFIAVVGIVGVYYWGTKYNSSNNLSDVSPSPIALNNGFNDFINTKYGISFSYDNSLFLTTQERATENGLDIFIATTQKEKQTTESCLESQQMECNIYPARISFKMENKQELQSISFENYLIRMGYTPSEMTATNINGIKGYKSDFEGIGIGTNYYLDLNPKTMLSVQTNALGFDEETRATNLKLLDQIISTLKTTQTTLYDYTDWKTYTDEVAGFSIKYDPNDQITKSSKGEYVFFSRYKLTVYDDYSGGSRREWLISKFDLTSYEISYEDYTVDGVDALIANVNDPHSMGSTFVVIPKGSKIYLLSKDSGAENNDEVKKIVSSFKFN